MDTKIKRKFNLRPDNWLLGDLEIDESDLEPIFRKFLNAHFNVMLDDITVWCMDGEELEINLGEEQGLVTATFDDVFLVMLDSGSVDAEVQYKCAEKLRDLANRIEKAGKEWEGS